MTGLQTVLCQSSAACWRCWRCFVPGLVRLAAQPTNPPATNAVAATNLSAPELVTTATETNFSLPTKLERFQFVLATARFQASTRD